MIEYSVCEKCPICTGDEILAVLSGLARWLRRDEDFLFIL